MPVAVDPPEERPRFLVQQIDPVLRGTHGASLAARPIRNPHPPSLPFLVGLRTANRYDQAVPLKLEVRQVEADELGTAKRPGKAKQQQRPVAHALQRIRQSIDDAP